MLYVFHVDTGTMLTFDMNLAMESVAQLQEAIGRTYRIPADKQVLLISGGENLDSKARVCSYSAGTDTNPIFLFSKSSIESATPPSASVNYGSESDLREQVEGSLNMPATYETVVARAQLALQFHDVGKEEMRVCERLVHDQHLQHLGWAAVIANLEDITSAFKLRSQGFKGNFTEYLSSRDHYIEVLASFPSTIQLLGKVPLLPCLIGETPPISDLTSLEGSDVHLSPRTLLEWISAQDNRSSVEQMIQQCQMGLQQQFCESVQEGLLKEVTSLIEAIDNPGMKEVKGLEDRLYGLEQLMYGARKLVKEQQDMAQGFVQNQNRASNLRDPSILPDLCASHKQQLLVMLKNHQSLRDIRRRCTAAKEELSANLHTRLRWVMFVEKSISDLDSKIMIHHDTLKKLRRKLEIVHQMDDAPNVYAKAIVEVVRRKMFARHFLDWAGSLAERCHHLHQEEVEQREQFSGLLKRHFLQSLFPGFEETPSQYATEAPENFDTKLPPITPDDVEFLKSQVPELADKLVLPSENTLCAKFSTATLKQESEMSIFPLCSSSNPHLSMVKEDPSASDIVILNHASDSMLGPPGGAGSIVMGRLFDNDEYKVGIDANLEEDKVKNTEEDVTQSVEVLDEEDEIGGGGRNVVEEEDEEEEFLSLQAEPVEPAACEAVTTVSSTSMDKSTSQSSASVPPVKIDKPGSKSSPETSPDLEEINSDGFTTADFFIDESMPSSMTESPPNKKMAELQLILHEKMALLENKDKEIDEQCHLVDEVKSKLVKSEESFRLLHDLAEKSTLQLKCEVLSMEKQFQKDKDEFQSYMDSITSRLVSLISRFEAEQEEERENSIKALKNEYDIQMRELSEQLEVDRNKLQDAQKEIENYQIKIEECDDLNEQLKQDLASQIADLKQKWAEEVDNTKKALILEHELELERVKSDLETDILNKDQEVMEMKIIVDNKDTVIEDLEKEKETVMESMNEKFQKEKEEIKRLLDEEYNAKKGALEKEIEKSLKAKHQADLDEMKKEMADKIEEAQTSVREEVQKEKEDALEKLRTDLQNEYENKVKELTETLLSKKEAEIEQIKETLGKERDEEIKKAIQEAQIDKDNEIKRIQAEARQERDAAVAALRSEMETERQKLSEEQKQKASTEAEHMSSEKHAQIISQLRSALEGEKTVAVNQAVELERARHASEIKVIQATLGKDKEESIQSMKTSITAEKQVVFNEAMTKVVAEKDKIIEQLEQKLLAEKKDRLSELLGHKPSEEESQNLAVQLGIKEAQLQDSQKQHDEEMREARYKMNQLQVQLVAMHSEVHLTTESGSPPQSGMGLQGSPPQSGMRLQGSPSRSVSQALPFGSPGRAVPVMGQSLMASVMPISESPKHSSSPTSAAAMHGRIQELEQTLKNRESELASLQNRMTSLSMSVSSRNIIQDKVSITTCQVGDIVLLCLDERHDHYVVFNMGTTLHFLHTDCLETLGLKTGPGEPKKSWVLAAIVDKEYCQAKKAQNRFKVPLGTKFYRVKAKSWDREAALHRDSPPSSSSPAHHHSDSKQGATAAK